MNSMRIIFYHSGMMFITSSLLLHSTLSFLYFQYYAIVMQMEVNHIKSRRSFIFSFFFFWSFLVSFGEWKCSGY